MRKAIDIYRNLVAKDTVPAGAASDNGVNFLSITNGKIGQQSLGAFAIGTLVTQHPEIDFGVTLIPHTLAMTTFGLRKPGDPVNIEVDLMARYAERLQAATMADSA